jgi:phosphoglycolate phosphatase
LDRKYDIIGAYKNNINSIAVLYGYGSKEELKETNPIYCYTVLSNTW